MRAMADFLMPSLGADMQTGKVLEWRVAPGARVRPGDVVAVVETHKGAIDVEIFLDGVIDDLAPLDAELPVGALLAHVREAGEGAGASPAPAPAALRRVTTVSAPSALPLAPVRAVASARVRASPAARRSADAAGIDLGTLQGTGVDAAVTLADVERARAAGAAPAAQPLPPRPMAGAFDAAQMRSAIAAAMSRSKREIPHYYLGTTVDFGAATDWLDAYNSERDPAQRLLPAVLLLKAVARALVEVPQLNGFCEGGAFRPGHGIHIGWAVALRGGGLVAPAIHDVDRMDLAELMVALRSVVQRARAGGLRSSELTDATITVTSLGERGAESVYGVIVPPQVAIVGFGRVSMRPWVLADRVVARPLVTLSLAADHRVSDGHLGGRLLDAVAQALQRPAEL